MKLSDSRVYLYLFIMVLVVIILAALLGCGSAKIKEPVRWDNEPQKCFRERYCRYQEQNNTDKSSCMIWTEECSKLIDFEYCKKPENRIKIKVSTRSGIIEGDDFFAGCWTILK